MLGNLFTSKVSFLDVAVEQTDVDLADSHNSWDLQCFNTSSHSFSHVTLLVSKCHAWDILWKKCSCKIPMWKVVLQEKILV